MQNFPFLDTQAINPGICEICKSLIRGRNVNSVLCICVVPNLYIYVDIFSILKQGFLYSKGVYKYIHIGNEIPDFSHAFWRVIDHHCSRG